MSLRYKSFGVSLTIHFAILFLFLLILESATSRSQNVLEIDLTFFESYQKPVPAEEVSEKETRLQPRAHSETMRTEEKVQSAVAQPEKPNFVEDKLQAKEEKVEKNLPVSSEIKPIEKGSVTDEVPSSNVKFTKEEKKESTTPIISGAKSMEKQTVTNELLPVSNSTAADGKTGSTVAANSSKDLSTHKQRTSDEAASGNTAKPVNNESFEKLKTLSTHTAHRTNEVVKDKEERELYIKEKLSVISSIVQKNLSYPNVARRMGWEGKVLLSLTLKEDGTLEDVKVIQSSGYEILDRNAVDTIKRICHMFPKPPVKVNITLPIAYKLY